MHSIDITSDINQAMKDVNQTFWKDIPFAMSGAMVDSMFDVREQIVERTYPKSFEVRNRVFPRLLWKVAVRGAKGNAMYRVLRDALRNGGDAEILLQQQMLPSKNGSSPDREYIKRHAEGGSKMPTGGGSIAIPVNIPRSGTGRIPVAKKPARVRNKKGAFVKKGRGGVRLVMERQRDGDIRLWYVLAPSARIDKRFRFYEDSTETVMRVFSGHMNTRMNKVIARSRFR